MSALHEYRKLCASWHEYVGPHTDSPSSGLRLPLYEVLEFLDWSDRFNVFTILTTVSLEANDTCISESWILTRLLVESFITYPIDSSAVPVDHWLTLRNSIVHAQNGIRRPRPRIESLGLIDATHTVEEPDIPEPHPTKGAPKCEASFLGGSPLSCRESRDRLRQLIHRLSLPRRTPSELSYSCLDKCVTTMVQGTASRQFVLDSVTAIDDVAALDPLLVSEFVNGRNVCYIISGRTELVWDILAQFTDKLISVAAEGISQRDSEIPLSDYTCGKEVSLFHLTRTDTNLVWTSRNWPLASGDLVNQIHNLRPGSGHVCLRFRLLHRYSKPEEGQHTNSFTIAIPSIVPQAIQGNPGRLNLDVLALKNSLRAIHAHQSFVPVKESRLTQFLELASCHHIRVIAAVSDSSDQTRRESVVGLRFAEQFSHRCSQPPIIP